MYTVSDIRGYVRDFGSTRRIRDIALGCPRLHRSPLATPTRDTPAIVLVAVGLVRMVVEVVRQRHFTCNAVLIHVTEVFVLQTI